VLLGKGFGNEFKSKNIFNSFFFICLKYFKLKVFVMFLNEFIFKFIFK